MTSDVTIASQLKKLDEFPKNNPVRVEKLNQIMTSRRIKAACSDNLHQSDNT